MSSITVGSSDIFDCASIYNEDFSYSLPKSELEKYLRGDAFDHKEPYSKEQAEKLRQDITTLFERRMATSKKSMMLLLLNCKEMICFGKTV